MAEKLQSEIATFFQAHAQLEKALRQQKDEFIRDSAIQRFEFTFELFWKTLKLYAEFEGKIVNSPRESIREGVALGIMENSQSGLDMLEDRNLTVHSYNESLAERIYSRLSEYSALMKNAVDVIGNRIQEKI